MSKKRDRLLCLAMGNRETSMSYNEFVLPSMDTQEITILAFSPPEVDENPKIKTYSAYGSVFRYLVSLRRLLKQNRYDIVHAHSAHVAAFFLIARILSWPAPVPFSRLTIHATYQKIRFRNRVMLLVGSLALNQVIFCGKESSKSFPRYWHSFWGAKGLTIQNGVNVERIGIVAQGHERRKGSNFRVIYVGRLISIKNVDKLIMAF